jgi:hypothetical protein
LSPKPPRVGPTASALTRRAHVANAASLSAINGRQKRFVVGNPNLTYALTWTIALLLFGLTIPDSDRQHDIEFFWIIVLTILMTAAAGWTLRRPSTLYLEGSKCTRTRWLLVMLWTLLVLQLTREAISFGSLPLLSALGRGTVFYNDATERFGIVHTLLVRKNIVFLSAISLFCYYVYSERRFAVGFWVCVAISLLLMTRAALIPIAVQSAYLTYLCRRTSLRKILAGVVGVLVLAAAFEMIGDRRYYADDVYYRTSKRQDVGWSGMVGLGLTGAADYATRPIANLEYNLSVGASPLVKWDPLYIAHNIIPTAVLTRVLGRDRGELNEALLLSEQFNTCSYLLPYVRAFGILGGLVAIGFLAVAARLVSVAFSRDPARWCLVTVVLSQAVTLSVFSSTLNDIVVGLHLLLFFFFPVVQPAGGSGSRWRWRGGDRLAAPPR